MKRLLPLLLLIFALSGCSISEVINAIDTSSQSSVISETSDEIDEQSSEITTDAMSGEYVQYNSKFADKMLVATMTYKNVEIYELNIPTGEKTLYWAARQKAFKEVAKDRVWVATKHYTDKREMIKQEVFIDNFVYGNKGLGYFDSMGEYGYVYFNKVE